MSGARSATLPGRRHRPPDDTGGGSYTTANKCNGRFKSKDDLPVTRPAGEHSGLFHIAVTRRTLRSSQTLSLGSVPATKLNGHAV
jgi:hypothetical protein